MSPSITPTANSPASSSSVVPRTVVVPMKPAHVLYLSPAHYETSSEVTRNSLPRRTSTSALSHSGHSSDHCEVIVDRSPHERHRTSAVTNSSSSSASGMSSWSRTSVQQNVSDSGTTCRSAPILTRTTSTWRPSAYGLTTPAIASHSESSCMTGHRRGAAHEPVLHLGARHRSLNEVAQAAYQRLPSAIVRHLLVVASTRSGV